ncbi:RING finger protein 10 [Hypsibius exemplaris]|uniref:E3 ubiquitin-protein ligase RNF10 n=1 Tax=Hypsibius exemplaris TaxID=2072580 RepID=A0A1W0WJR9_HYPEX|nr:RING finger protein 10 [Hypsibius exemplaris]
MDKRYGMPLAGNQAGQSGSGGSGSRGSQGQTTSFIGRTAGSQAPITYNQGSNNRGGSQQRVPARSQQNQPAGRGWGSSKGGQQPQGLGGFRELGINGVEQGTRKHNYNHLINLSYGHRAGSGSGERHHHGSSHGHSRHVASYQPKYNKERFLQANCQFVVKQDGEYAVHHVDPDVLVDWNNIELIKVYSSEEQNCPICLHPPTAAKMTRCGHVFCWPCILHYLALSDAKWRKCPICYESVYGSELKSVVTHITESVKVGQDITMRLMVCERSSVWAFPVTEWYERKGIFYNIEEENVSLGFSKFLTIRDNQIEKEILSREERELLFALETDGDSPESCFIEDALKDLAKRVATFSPIPSTPVDILPSVKSARPILPKKSYSSAFMDEEAEVSQTSPTSPVPVEVSAASSFATSEASSELDAKMKPDSVAGVTAASKGKGQQQRQGQPSFFYQAADGQHVYLHPMSVKMLVAQYGELSASPVEITAPVLEVESWSITDNVRKRYRYLSHLPLTCVIHLVELDLKPPYISEEVLHEFAEEVLQREHHRLAKLRYEERGQRDAENAFRKDIRGQISFSLQSEFFPDVGSSAQESLDFASDEAFPAVGAEPAAPALTPSPPVADAGSRSFAQMLRQGKAQPQQSLHQQSASTSRSDYRATQQHHSDGGMDDDEYHLAAPDFQRSFSTGLDAAFSRMKMSEKDAAAPSAASAHSGGGGGKGSKKKRSKGTLLFSTGSVPRV